MSRLAILFRDCYIACYQYLPFLFYVSFDSNSLEWLKSNNVGFCSDDSSSYGTVILWRKKYYIYIHTYTYTLILYSPIRNHLYEKYYNDNFLYSEYPIDF